jgi:hypothetical protein
MGVIITIWAGRCKGHTEYHEGIGQRERKGKKKKSFVSAKTDQRVKKHIHQPSPRTVPGGRCANSSALSSTRRAPSWTRVTLHSGAHQGARRNRNHSKQAVHARPPKEFVHSPVISSFLDRSCEFVETPSFDELDRPCGESFSLLSNHTGCPWRLTGSCNPELSRTCQHGATGGEDHADSDHGPQPNAIEIDSSIHTRVMTAKDCDEIL